MLISSDSHLKEKIFFILFFGVAVSVRSLASTTRRERGHNNKTVEASMINLTVHGPVKDRLPTSPHMRWSRAGCGGQRLKRLCSGNPTFAGTAGNYGDNERFFRMAFSPSFSYLGLQPQPAIMKTLSILSSVLALGILAAPGEPADAQRSTGQVTLRVSDKTVRPERVRSTDDKKKDSKQDKAKSESVTKTLEIEISAARSINGPLKIVTHWYARDMATKKQVVANKHESEVTLDASKTATATVPSQTFTHTPARSSKEGRSSATGQDYGGWVVRAYEGDKLVGEAASSAPLLKIEE